MPGDPTPGETLADQQPTDTQTHGVVSVSAQSLDDLVQEVRQLHQLVAETAGHSAATSRSAEPPVTPPDHEDSSAGTDALEAEIERLRYELTDVKNELADAQIQNEELASQANTSAIRQRVESETIDSGESLSWEERKLLIIQQMENDSFDAGSFVEQLADDSVDAEQVADDPVAYVEGLHDQLRQAETELQNRSEEIGELRMILDQQSSTCGGGLAVGAAAIAEMVDSDDLVREERDRLQQMQVEWEEKFRQAEIEASLERAKLSRERQELAKKNEELDEKLEQLRRDRKDASDGATSSRRWLAKLGLNDDD